VVTTSSSPLSSGTIFGLLEAEEYGITQANVDDLKANSKDPVVGRILGTTEDTGKLLGLDKELDGRAIKATGNYGEIFERNVGPSRRWAAARQQQPVEQGRLHVRPASSVRRLAAGAPSLRAPASLPLQDPLIPRQPLFPG
jgi:hypothetical protein